MCLKLNPFCILCHSKCSLGMHILPNEQWISPNLTSTVAQSLTNELKQSKSKSGFWFSKLIVNRLLCVPTGSNLVLRLSFKK